MRFAVSTSQPLCYQDTKSRWLRQVKQGSSGDAAIIFESDDGYQRRLLWIGTADVPCSFCDIISSVPMTTGGAKPSAMFAVCGAPEPPPTAELGDRQNIRPRPTPAADCETRLRPRHTSIYVSASRKAFSSIVSPLGQPTPGNPIPGGRGPCGSA